MMNGFLGTRGDFLSDLLIVALALSVPALITGIVLARSRRLKAHRIVMLAIYYVLVGYVVIYEGNMIRMGGMDFLRSKLMMPETPYFVATSLHIAIGLTALILGAIVVRKGSKLLPEALSNPEREKRVSKHFTI